MEAEENPAETPETFLESLGKSLRVKEGVDVGLADILIAQLLKADTAQDAVPLAKSAIIKLAGERANPPKIEETSG